MSPLRWGICSAGRISFDFADALQSLPVEEHRMVAVAARDLNSAKTFAEKFYIPKCFNCYEALANDPEVDIVYVGSLQNAHYDLCKLFLNAGKHVLCEKALTCAAWQAEDLVALAKEKQRFFMEAMWSRCFPLSPKIRDIANSGELGKLQFVEVHFMFDVINAAGAERLRKEELGGGILWDVGVYALQFAQLIFNDEPERVSVVGKLLENGVDSSACITLQYSEGRFAVLTVSCSAAQEITASIHGTDAKLFIEERFYIPQRVTITRRNGDSRTIEAEPLPIVKYPTNYVNSAGLVYEAEHVRTCLKDGLLESPLVPHSLSIWMQKTIDECLRQLGRPNLPQKDSATTL